MKAITTILVIFFVFVACETEKEPIPSQVAAEAHRRLDEVEMELSRLVGDTPKLTEDEEFQEWNRIMSLITDTGALFRLDYAYEGTELNRRYIKTVDLAEDIWVQIEGDDGPYYDPYLGEYLPAEIDD